jgi:hypothetical protein
MPNHTILETTTCIIVKENLPKVLWVKLVHATCYLVNRRPSKTLDQKTPLEVFSRKKSHLKNLKVLGAQAYIHVPITS